MFFIKAIIKFYDKYLFSQIVWLRKTSDTYYINNDYTNVTKVYEEFIEIGRGSKHKKRRKTKKTSISKE